MIVYVGIAIVGVGVLPVNDGVTALGTTHINAPLVGVVEALHPVWLRDCSSTRWRSAAPPG